MLRRWFFFVAITWKSIDPFEISRRADFNWITKKGKEGRRWGGGHRKREKRVTREGPEQEALRARRLDLRHSFPRRGSVVSAAAQREREGLVSTFQRK